MKTINRKEIGLMALILLATALVYLPSYHGDFLWDDDAYISENASLTTLHGLHDIWLKPGSQQQYYPLTFSVFWLEHHMWGLNPVGYHALNVLVHGLNAILFGFLLEGLGLGGAWIAAAFFALHPVQVESVAWMTELKNVLSTFFYLLTCLFLVRTYRNKENRFYTYTISVLFFLCALLSKSITVTLPVAYLALTAWMEGRFRRETWLGILPFLALAAGIGFFTLHYEHRLVGAEGHPWSFAFSQRLIIAGHAFWFYLGKLIYPTPIVFIYPRWTLEANRIVPYLYPISAKRRTTYFGNVRYQRSSFTFPVRAPITISMAGK